MNDKHTGDWDTYWRGTHDNAAHREGGPQEEVLARFWSKVFSSPAAKTSNMLDIACGNGAVTGHAITNAVNADLFCTDYSYSAMIELRKRHLMANCAVADAAQLPWADGSFGLVVSQFGLEYAGSDALLEAARLVAPGGCLAVVVHLHGGGIYRECDENKEVVDAIADTRLLALARLAFKGGFALNRGEASVEAFKASERAFTPAVRGLEDILRRYGSSAADGLPKQLYSDVASMYSRMSSFEEDEVMRWIDGMEKELEAYHGRMQSMLHAAVSEVKMEQLLTQLQQTGFDENPPQILRMGQDSEPAAWALILHRAA
ncbi:MAG: class I SAM-dependent methyltransferase [Halioglobus sp.]